MRNVLLSLFSVLFLLQAGAAHAQIVTQNGKDTATGSYTGGSSFTVENRIKSGSANPLVLKWNVVSHNLGTVAGWGIENAGVCDNQQCYTYSATPSQNVFNPAIKKESLEYNGANFDGLEHDFHVLFDTNNPANGTSAFVRVYMQDMNSGDSRTLTFIATKGALGVNTVTSSDDIVLYPNPARDAVNVIYDPNSGVKTIAVFNLIGKLVGPIYKPATNGSARIVLDDMPTGIYFMRLMDAHGRVVATRRFTRQ